MKKGDQVHITWIDTYDPQIPSWADDEQIAEAYSRITGIPKGCIKTIKKIRKGKT